MTLYLFFVLGRWHPAAPQGDGRLSGQGDDLRGPGGGRSGGVSPRPRQSLRGAEQERRRRLPAGPGARPRDQPTGEETPLRAAVFFWRIFTVHS